MLFCWFWLVFLVVFEVVLYGFTGGFKGASTDKNVLLKDIGFLVFSRQFCLFFGGFIASLVFG